MIKTIRQKQKLFAKKRQMENGRLKLQEYCTYSTRAQTLLKQIYIFQQTNQIVSWEQRTNSSTVHRVVYILENQCAEYVKFHSCVSILYFISLYASPSTPQKKVSTTKNDEKQKKNAETRKIEMDMCLMRIHTNTQISLLGSLVRFIRFIPKKKREFFFIVYKMGYTLHSVLYTPFCLYPYPHPQPIWNINGWRFVWWPRAQCWWNEVDVLMMTSCWRITYHVAHVPKIYTTHKTHTVFSVYVLICILNNSENATDSLKIRNAGGWRENDKNIRIANKIHSMNTFHSLSQCMRYFVFMFGYTLRCVSLYKMSNFCMWE